MTILGTRRNPHFEAGIQNFDHGQLEATVRELRQVLDERSGAVQGERKLARFYLGEAHGTLAERHVQLENWTAAEEHLKEALDINPGYADLHYQLAKVYFLMGRLQEAASEVNESLVINPRFAKALYLEGLINYRAGNHEIGLRRVTEAAQLEPVFQTDQIEKAAELNAEGRYDEAIEILMRVGDMRADRVADLIRKAKGSLRAGRLPHAEALLWEALRINPDYPDLHNLMGQMWILANEFLRAVNEFKIAIQINPRFIQAHINLGLACRAMGNEDAAISAFKQALSLDPDNEEVRELLSKA